VRKDELQRELEECREEKVKLQLKLEVCKVKKGELQRQLEDTRKAIWVLAKAIVAATKAYDAEKAKMMKELEELKSKQLRK
jgi:predicted  nucleic acid-binding Zn-ribbon protein